MPPRFFAVFALTVFTLGLFASAAAPASAQPAPVKPLGTAVANFGPPSALYDLEDLYTFSWTMHRELTGPAAQRVYGVYKDNFKTEIGMVPATLPANGRFVLDWDGANDNPDNFVQTLSIGKNQWTEWMVGSKGKAQYNADPLINLNGTRNELMFWWAGIAQWLDTNKSSLDCGTSPRRVNEEQAVRCLIPTLTQDAKIALSEKLGIYTEEATTSVTNMVFELWVTKEDTIPVQLSVQMSIVDARNVTSTGVFNIDIFDIESDDIHIQLPK
jgi:hypothetical protein